MSIKIITYEEFEQVELPSGTITKVEEFPRAKKPAFKIWADFGSQIGILQTYQRKSLYITLQNLYSEDLSLVALIWERKILLDFYRNSYY